MTPVFRDLCADEIEARVNQVNQYGVTLILYIDARAAMNILDETFGPLGWQRRHTRDNQNCIVSVWDEEKKQWIEKEDTGTESNTEKEKGLASDSFKRACVNVGIGRELYTAPEIRIGAQNCASLIQSGDKWKCFDSFAVEKIVIENKKIVALAIRNVKTGRRCFVWQDQEWVKRKGGDTR